MAKQSDKPEDTYKARTDGLLPDEYDEDQEGELIEIDPGPCLSRRQILDAEDLRLTMVLTPEWGGHVFVKPLTGDQRAAVEKATVSIDPKGVTQINYRYMRERLVALSVVDADGKRIFAEADMPALAEKSAAVLDRIFDVAQEVSGISTAAKEGAVKN